MAVLNQKQRSEVDAKWRDAAPYWHRHAETVRSMFAPVTAAMIKAAEIAPGDGVLDIAGGSGEPALTIAEHVAPLGAVMCTDLVEDMLKAAEMESRRRGIGNVAFFHAPAEDLPFDASSFDAVTCRFGAMFFADPSATFQEAR